MAKLALPGPFMGSGISLSDLENLTLPQIYVLMYAHTTEKEATEKKVKTYWTHGIAQQMDKWKAEAKKKAEAK